MTMAHEPKIGDLYVLKHQFGRNEKGAVGVCYQAQSARGEIWVSLIFPTGDHVVIRDDYLDGEVTYIGVYPELATYKPGVTDATLMADFREGVFTPAWSPAEAA